MPDRRRYCRLRALYLMMLLAAVPSGCEPTATPAPQRSAGDVPAPPQCGAAEVTLADGRCQQPGLPLDMPCAPGELALEGGVCQPAGVPPARCAQGFDPDGVQGCSAILPEDACPPGLMATPGDARCREIVPCSPGRWGDAPFDATTQFVDLAYTDGQSDGTRQRPWRTIQEGVNAAEPGAVVAVASGRYVEAVVVHADPVRLWGRCPSQVEIVSPREQEPALWIDGERSSGSEIRGLAVTGPSGVALSYARSVTLDRVWIHDVGEIGLLVGARAAATVRASLIERATEFGILGRASDVTLEASVVRATTVNAAGQFGVGIYIMDLEPAGRRSSALLRSSVIERNHYGGLLALGSTLQLEGTVVRDTTPDATPRFGVGISVENDVATGERGQLGLFASVIERNHHIGVRVLASEGIVEGSTIRSSRSSGDGGRIGSDEYGVGVVVESDRSTGDRGALLVRTSVVAGNQHAGVLIQDSTATIEASVVRGTRPNDRGEFGRGIAVEFDGSSDMIPELFLRSSLVDRNHEGGVFVLGGGATIDASLVRGDLSSLAQPSRRGVNVQASTGSTKRGQLYMTSSIIEQSAEIGLFAAGADIAVETSIVRDTAALMGDAPYGDGICVTDEVGPSTVAITATLTSSNARAGIVAVGSGGELRRAMSSGNRFGLVLQGDVQPIVDHDCSFEGNEKYNLIEDGSLPIPSSASAIP